MSIVVSIIIILWTHWMTSDTSATSHCHWTAWSSALGMSASTDRYGDLYHMIMYYYVYDDYYFVQNGNHKQFSASIQLANRQTAFLWTALKTATTTTVMTDDRPRRHTPPSAISLACVFVDVFDGIYYHLVNTHLIGKCGIESVDQPRNNINKDTAGDWLHW